MNKKPAMRNEIKKLTDERNLFAKLLEETNLQFEGKVKELSLLKRIGDIISDSFNIESFCQKLALIIIEETNAENCSLLLKHRDSDKLILKVAYGIRDNGVAFFENVKEAKVIFSVGEGIAGKVAFEGKAIMINDVSKDERFDRSKKSNLAIGSILCCPLIVQNQVLGVINLSSSRINAFNNDDIRSISIFSAFASSILNNAILYNDMSKVNNRLVKAVNKLKVTQKKLKQEIEEGKQAEYDLVKSRAFLEKIFKTSVDGIIIADSKGSIISVNDAVEKMLGCSHDKLVGIHTSEFGFEERTYKESGEELIRQLLSKGTVSGVERTWLKMDGKTLDIEMNIALLKDTRGDISGSVASIRDITERKRAEETLKKSEEKYHNLIEHANDAIVSVNKDGRIIGFNKKAEEMFGCSREEMIEKPSYHLVAQQHRERQKKLLKEFAETGTRSAIDKNILEGKAIRKDGTTFDIEFSYYMLDVHGESIATAIIRDITERKEAEEKLLHNQEQLRSLASQLTRVEEQERRNIASYLHDHLGQELFAMKLQLEQFKKSLPAKHTVKTLESAIERTNQMMGDMRSMSYELSPPILYELGLEAALEWIIEEMRSIRPITITFHDDGLAKPLDETTKVLLFQAVRELLHNVTRHAKAQNVEISVARENAMVIIQVNDDGIGFEGSEADASKEKTQGFGLYSIKERLKYSGGDLAVESALNRGTRIILKAPLHS